MKPVWLLLCFGALSSCATPYKTVNRTALLALTEMWNAGKVDMWYYVGSKDGYDCFKNLDLGIEHNYKIERGEIELPRRFPETSKRSMWIPMPWGATAPR